MGFFAIINDVTAEKIPTRFIEKFIRRSMRAQGTVHTPHHNSYAWGWRLNVIIYLLECVKYRYTI